jgi:hypothetical protein
MPYRLATPQQGKPPEKGRLTGEINRKRAAKASMKSAVALLPFLWKTPILALASFYKSL